VQEEVGARLAGQAVSSSLPLHFRRIPMRGPVYIGRLPDPASLVDTPWAPC
jgi:hypothetical protein